MSKLVKKVALTLLRAWFTATFVVSISFAAFLTKITQYLVFLSPQRRQKLSAQIAGICFRIIFSLNPQISIENVSHEKDKEAPWHELFAGGQSAPIVLINHTSPLDSIFFSACVPASEIQHLKTLAKSSLFSLPLFGTIMNSCGHFPVFFAKESAVNNFSVDKTEQEKVMQEMEMHIAQGGGLSMFPEGQINRECGKTLQSFRRGSLQVARNKNMTLWGFLHTGVENVWHLKDTFGGYPGTIKYKLFKIELPKYIRESSPEDFADFVLHVEKIMQCELDLMHALESHNVKEIQLRRQLLLEEIDLTAQGDDALKHQIEETITME